MKLSGKQNTVLTHLFYKGTLPGRTSYRTVGRLKALDLMHFDLPNGKYVLTGAGRQYVTSRPWFEKNRWLWEPGMARPQVAL